jgi:hypothetical protein
MASHTKANTWLAHEFHVQFSFSSLPSCGDFHVLFLFTNHQNQNFTHLSYFLSPLLHYVAKKTSKGCCGFRKPLSKEA